MSIAHRRKSCTCERACLPPKIRPWTGYDVAAYLVSSRQWLWRYGIAEGSSGAFGRASCKGSCVVNNC